MFCGVYAGEEGSVAAANRNPFGVNQNPIRAGCSQVWSRCIYLGEMARFYDL
jgi:hypothetical protein